MSIKIVPRLKKRWFRKPITVYDLFNVFPKEMHTSFDCGDTRVSYQDRYELIHTFESKEEALLYKSQLEQDNE